MLTVSKGQLVGMASYGWQNGAKFIKFIFIHIQCHYCYSQIHIFSLNQVYIQEIYLFTLNGVFLIYEYIYSHLGDVFIYIQQVIFIHIRKWKIISTFSVHHLCSSLGLSSPSKMFECNMADGGWQKTKHPDTSVTRDKGDNRVFNTFASD